MSSGRRIWYFSEEKKEKYMKKIITICIVFLSVISHTYAADDDFFDSFRSHYQGYINTHATIVDTQIEWYLESIQFFEGRYIELIRDIGERFSRGWLVQVEERSWFNEYNQVCNDGYTHAVQRLAQEQWLEQSILSSTKEHIRLRDICKTLMSNKLIAYKQSASILAFEQLGRIIEYDHRTYFQKVKELQKDLMSKIHRTITKMSETSSTYKPVKQVLN